MGFWYSGPMTEGELMDQTVKDHLAACGHTVKDGVVVVGDSTVTLPPDVTPGPGTPDWVSFLEWKADGATAAEIVSIVEKPWHYRGEYAEFLVETALEVQAS